MAKANPVFYKPRSSYPDRTKTEDRTFPDLNICIKNVQTAFLLLHSEEEYVLASVFNHITIYVRRAANNIMEIKENNLLDVLLEKKFFNNAESILIKRFSLYLMTCLMDVTDMSELELDKTNRILELMYKFYLDENDEFCLEYITYVVNMCLRDPQVAMSIQKETDFLEKLINVFITTENPDVVQHTLEILFRILQVQNSEEVLKFTTTENFPIERVICELTSEFNVIVQASLKILKLLLSDTGDESVFESLQRCAFIIKQLVESICSDPQAEDNVFTIEVLTTALSTEKMGKIFFEQNFFEKLLECIKHDFDLYPMELRCSIMSIFAEAAKYERYLSRMFNADITHMFATCLMESEPAPPSHVITGLNRIIKYPEALRYFLTQYENGALVKLMKMFKSPAGIIKAREQTGEIIGHLLTLAYRETAEELMSLDIPNVLTLIIKQGIAALSIDIILALLAIIESLAQNDEYRARLGENRPLTEQIALMLMYGFAHSILVNNIFRCLCTLIDEEPVREGLLKNFIISSMKRALKSLSNLVKTSVTNFILQTTRFNEFIDAYIDRGILEVLMTFQKHAFCVSTWGPAIESILSKCPTMKFCIRNALGFTDITAGKDFFVSKQKFNDFLCFQSMLREDCSPLDAILVVNFDRAETHESDKRYTGTSNDGGGDFNWEYSKRPGDEYLPQYLEALNKTLEIHGLLENPDKIRRSIDFENVAKRCKIIAEAVASVLSQDIKPLDLNSTDECSRHTVRCHFDELRKTYHTNFIPLGAVRSGCQFERAILFKCFADQIGLPSTLQRSVDGRMLYNEVPLPVEIETDVHCDRKTLKFMPWRMLRPTHIVDLMYNVGEVYPLQSRQALQYLRLY